MWIPCRRWLRSINLRLFHAPEHYTMKMYEGHGVLVVLNVKLLIQTVVRNMLLIVCMTHR